MKIKRFYKNPDTYLKPNKVLVIYGPRRVGKTTLLTDYLTDSKLKWKLDSGDNIKIQQILSSADFDAIKEYAAGYSLIAIDEAQKIPKIGEGLKILVDQIPGIKVIAAGSSSFELSGQVGEPLTGRKTTVTLYPVSQLELAAHFNQYELREHLPERLIYGSYPEVTVSSNPREKANLLEELVNSYLLKDILELKRVKGSKILLDLLRLVAFQLGGEVSLTELGGQLGIDTKTVGRYLDLLEKSFVLINLRGFSRNLRKEVVKKSKYYLFDTGIRNAVISNFNPLEKRDDQGALWENFIIIERLKKRAYAQIHANQYFWRTWDGKEIDLIEEREGKLFAFEMKWQDGQSVAPRDWQQAYPGAEFATINRKNYLDFV